MGFLCFWQQTFGNIKKQFCKGDSPIKEEVDHVALFTKILTIDFDLKRKRTILFLFTKILTRILAC